MGENENRTPQCGFARSTRDTSAIAANVNTKEDMFWSTDYRYFDQYTLKEISVNHLYGRLKDANFADKLIRMNYDIHTGGILGFAGKILAFFLSLVAASLPITGFYIWWGRRKKQKQTQLPLIKIKKIQELIICKI